jgi:hypothetical protein
LTTWETLNGYVKTWRNRYPRQTYYVLRTYASKADADASEADA